MNDFFKVLKASRVVEANYAPEWPSDEVAPSKWSNKQLEDKLVELKDDYEIGNINAERMGKFSSAIKAEIKRRSRQRQG